MWSSGGEVAKKKAMWIYPKVSGFNPSQRWGHSACYSGGHLYVFGGCCGGLHFSDVLVLDLEVMVWRSLATTGEGPGPRDSHSAVLVGQSMIVFGGTNGSKKVNDLHILDLRTKVWSQLEVRGRPPSPRESHTATLVGNDRIVIFGGSGEGEGNYLNDLHVLDLKAMRWSSPEVKGTAPVPRDSHSAVAVGNRLLVYGGDRGDRYHGDVDVLDVDTMIWSKLDVEGFSPGVRAGHSAVSIGTKVYVVGGVGDKHYYGDVWVLDLDASTWTQLDIRGQQPQGRFSHAAAVVDTSIAIYGGCGEDEHPLNELLLLQLGEDNVTGHRDISSLKVFGKHLNQKTLLWESNEAQRQGVPDHHLCPDGFHLKKRRTASSNAWEIESEQEEHSLSLSQNSSPSQSDQEQPPTTKAPDSARGSHELHLFRPTNQVRSNEPPNNVSNSWKEFRNYVRRTPQEQSTHVLRQYEREQFLAQSGLMQSLIGADVRGKVDGAFDSGYLVTANVNGRVFRGVLFAPGSVGLSRGVAVAQNPPQHTAQIPMSHPLTNSSHISSISQSVELPASFCTPASASCIEQVQVARPFRAVTAAPRHEVKPRNDLHGVVLTLGGPGTGRG